MTKGKISIHDLKTYFKVQITGISFVKGIFDCIVNKDLVERSNTLHDKLISLNKILNIQPLNNDMQLVCLPLERKVIDIRFLLPFLKYKYVLMLPQNIWYSCSEKPKIENINNKNLFETFSLRNNELNRILSGSKFFCLSYVFNIKKVGNLLFYFSKTELVSYKAYERFRKLEFGENT